MTGVDVLKIVWRSVDENEFYGSENEPYRITAVNGTRTFELGTLPRELPTKRGAVLVPTAEWLERHNGEDWDEPEFSNDTFFTYDGTDWVALSTIEAYFEKSNLVDVQDALNAGGTIVFEGIDD